MRIYGRRWPRNIVSNKTSRTAVGRKEGAREEGVNEALMK